MKICIDTRKIADFGIGTYVRNLLEHLSAIDHSNDYYLLFNPADIDHYNYPGGNFHKLADCSRKYGVREHWSIPRKLEQYDIGVYHSPHYVTPVWKKKPTIVTIHDLIHLIFPQYLPSKAAHFYAQLMFRNSINRSDKIITDSEWSKKDMVRILNVHEQRIKVIYPAVDEQFHKIPNGSPMTAIAEKFQIDDNYALYVGSFKPHKNVDNLITAFGSINQKLCRYLVLAGDRWHNFKDLQRLVQETGLTARILTFERLGIKDLNLLYNGAEIFIFPSRYEGFGLPPLEAMKCEIPVAASNASCIPEILGDGAIYFHPGSTAEITQRLEDILMDSTLRKELIERGKDRVKVFSWLKTARETLEIYREVSTS